MTPGDQHPENATVVAGFTLHYGLSGPVDVPAGTRGLVEDADPATGLCRFSGGAADRALCDAAHFLLDEDVRHGS